MKRNAPAVTLAALLMWAGAVSVGSAQAAPDAGGVVPSAPGRSLETCSGCRASDGQEPDSGASDSGPALSEDDRAQLADAGIYPVASAVLCDAPRALADGGVDACPPSDTSIEGRGWYVTPPRLTRIATAYVDLSNALTGCQAALAEEKSTQTDPGFWWGDLLSAGVTLLVAVPMTLVLTGVLSLGSGTHQP